MYETTAVSVLFVSAMRSLPLADVNAPYAALQSEAQMCPPSTTTIEPFM